MKKIEDFCIAVAVIIIFWLVASTIDVNNKNLSDKDYAKWNLWKIMDDHYESEITQQIYSTKPVKGAANYSDVNVLESPFIFLGEFKITGYCGCVSCCGKNDCMTATGTHAIQGRTVAVDPSVIPYGSEIIIDGKHYIAEDCGGAINGNRIDIFFNNHTEALDYGVNYSEVILCKKQ